MKTEEKKSSGNTAGKPGKKRRSLKALGMGIGAVGMATAAGGQLPACAATDLFSSNRVAIQKAICQIAQNTQKLNEFLDKPEEVAGELGIRLTLDEALRIQRAVRQIADNKDASGQRFLPKSKQLKSRAVKQPSKLKPLGPGGVAWVEPFDPASRRKGGDPLKKKVPLR